MSGEGHGPDWSDSLPGEPPSCRCGYNGTPEECEASLATPAEPARCDVESIHGDGRIRPCAYPLPCWRHPAPAEPVRCDTCGDKGRVPWMVEGDPNCYQERDADDTIPCPDCTVEPARESDGVGLTQEERRSLGCTCWKMDGEWHHVFGCPTPTVERIIAARVAEAGARALEEAADEIGPFMGATLVGPVGDAFCSGWVAALGAVRERADSGASDD